METVEFPLQAGGRVLVQVSEHVPTGTVTTRGGAERLHQAEQTFEAALSTIESVADGVFGQLRQLARSPDEVEVEFGLELTAKTAAIIAAAGTSAQFRVRLLWRPGEDERAAAARVER